MKSNFSRLPTVSISRSKFLRKSQHKTSLKLGELTPIYLDEVLPGDTRKIDVGSLIRMSTPVAPVMDNIYLDMYAFFVPNRLVWTHWKEFMGENNSSAGIYSGTAYSIPKSDLFYSGLSVGSLGDHLGLPVVGSPNYSKHLYVSSLPLRGYRRIYNRFFRDQNVIAPVTVNMTDNGAGDSYNDSLYKVAKVSDYFTRSLPYAQKGAPVTIPLGTTAPVIVMSTEHNNPYWSGDQSLVPQLKWAYYNASGTIQSTSGNLPIAVALGGKGTYTYDNGSFDTGDKDSDIVPSNLYTDLSQATAASINSLRFAFQYQKMLEKDALYGTRLNAR